MQKKILALLLAALLTVDWKSRSYPKKQWTSMAVGLPLFVITTSPSFSRFTHIILGVARSSRTE